MNAIVIVFSVTLSAVFAANHHLDLHGVVIKNPHSGLVLDGSDIVIKTAKFSGALSQIWRLEHTGTGTFYIVNKASGKVLQKSADSYEAITFEKHEGCPEQQWFYERGQSVVNLKSGNLLDIKNEKYEVGIELIIHPRKPQKNQKFEFVLV